MGSDRVFKVGTFYRKIFDNGIAYSEARNLLQQIRGLSYDTDVTYEGVSFASAKTLVRSLKDHARAVTLDKCDVIEEVNGSDHRVLGKMKAQVISGCPYQCNFLFGTFFEIVTKMQKKVLGIWINEDADEIWGSGQLQFKINGTVANSPYVSDYRTNSKVLFASQSDCCFSGDDEDVEFGYGWGSHHTKRGTQFDEACNTGN